MKSAYFHLIVHLFFPGWFGEKIAMVGDSAGGNVVKEIELVPARLFCCEFPNEIFEVETMQFETIFMCSFASPRASSPCAFVRFPGVSWKRSIKLIWTVPVNAASVDQQ